VGAVAGAAERGDLQPASERAAKALEVWRKLRRFMGYPWGCKGKGKSKGKSKGKRRDAEDAEERSERQKQKP